MKEKAKALFDKTKERLKKISKKIWIAIAAVLVVLIVAIAIVLTLNKQEYAVLVTQVSNTEASNILNFLSSQGVTNYKVEDGNTILVPENQEDALRARILMENLNQTGHYYMENISSFSTNEERSTALRLDLQESMAATIRNFPNVVDATVNITPGENRAYVLDSGNVVKASAAVSVTMVEGAMLSDEQAEAIRHFVTYSVQGLEIESVSITDKIGNIYLTGNEGMDGEASALKLQLQQTFENRIRTEVMNILVPIFGEDNVRVGVNCDVEISRTTEQRHEVYLPEYAQDGSTGGRGPIGAEEYEYYTGRPGEDPIGGLVGSEVNSDLPENVEDLADPESGDNMVAGSGKKEYDNSSSEILIDNNGVARVTDCSVAVSVNSRTAGDFDIDNIRRHVARAAGISGVLDEVTGEEILDSKISVVSMEFYDPDAALGPVGGGESGAAVPLWVLIAACIGLLLFIILLIVILLVRRKRRKKREAAEEQERREMEAMMAAAGLGEAGSEEPQDGADVMSLEMERSMELRRDIRQFVSDNPEIAAQMLKTWLKGGDDNG
ncbi:flagellar M-ring protein FliF C-terminal domain-containing protein [uncultured Oscillibacter sp.]|uniref:flagellar M-ring protein FliF C-terminal domain-containing protein n=1 Tax=uncultured Oscillibacter sp. TaxID=876091 RepID=UPI0025D10FEF|nr:flagellar M-ring protein FliF C-terminal domain-containing protein [uncultured Oscillibacter sp.]